MATSFISELPPALTFLTADEFEPSARLAESLQDLSTAGYEIGSPIPINTVRKHAERSGKLLDQADLDTGLMVLTHRGLLEEVGHGNIRPIGALFQALQQSLFCIKETTYLVTTSPTRDPRIYAIPAGGSERSLWATWREEGILTVYGPEWDLVRDLRTYGSYEDYKDDYTPRFGNKGIKKDLWTLRNLRPGDIIIAIQGQSWLLGYGVVKAPGYFYRKGLATECHAVEMTWSNLPARAVPRQPGWLKTVHEVRPDDFDRWFPETRGPQIDLVEEEQALAEDGAFTSLDAQDARKKVLAAIVRRRGQSAFRDALFARYGIHCLVTGCDVPEALEAAHIVPYLGDHTNQAENGLLLRADIHTLFDLGLLDIDESTWTIRLQKRLQEGAYRELEGQYICWGAAGPPPAQLFRQRRDLLGWTAL